MFTLLVQLEVRSALLDEFAVAVSENARSSRLLDPGCLRFEVLQVVGEPTRWVLYEVYEDEESWQRHRKSPHFTAYQAVAERAILSRTATRLSPLDELPAS